jgi:hypothetical protein
VDAFTLDSLIAELRPLIVGRHVVRVRAAEAQAVVLEVQAVRVWLDAGRVAPGLYALGREEARALLAPDALVGPSRQAVLHLRKHLEGQRLTGLSRVAGHRAVVLEAGDVALVLRLSGTPALTLAVAGEAQATVGEGAPAWPPPGGAPQQEWDHIEDRALLEAIASAHRESSPPARAVLRLCPGLGPVLARVVGEADAAGLASLRLRLAEPRPAVLAPGPLDACADVDLVPADAVALLPAPLERPGRTVWPQATWSAAAAAFLRARLRGHRFDRQRRARLDAAARQTRRLAQLLRHLEDDLAGLPAAAGLRRQAEALLAAHQGPEVRGGEIEVADPYQPDSWLRVRVDPRLTLPANADRLFEKARRLERARAQVESRLAQTRARLDAAHAVEASLRAARRREELPGREDGRPPSGAPASAPREGGPRHYLTSRGLSVLVGRGARENHHLTFTVARPEDLWLHARDVPGAHVIVRDPEGRASPEDLREAAELAAFFSAAAPQGQVDVHVTRRKHVRPTRGGAGRVVVGHSDTLRVVPRDPEGRLRRR